MTLTVSKIYRHPVKGLTPEELTETTLTSGQAIKNDRRFALALGSTPVQGTVSEWMAKTNYLMLARNERLAQLETSFEDETDALTIKRNGRQVSRGVLTTPMGRTVIEDFFAAFMGDEARGRPKVVEAADGHALSDHKNPVVSIINLASIKDLERVIGDVPDPRRFRGNLLIDGLDAWAEFDLVGESLICGDVELEVTERIDRCAAINVNPITAERDLNLPKSLQRAFGHIDCGVYARVVRGGALASGAILSIKD